MKIIELNEELPGFKKCRKRPIIVKAVQINEPFKVKSLEGEVEGKAGDYVIQGVEGENYICDQAIFNKTYDFVNVDEEIESLVKQLESNLY